VTVNVVADVNQVRVGALQIVPGPIAGAGLPALMALGGFVWARRRKAAATA
jgi:LPXTG-motif cell wall-anchored protein